MDHLGRFCSDPGVLSGVQGLVTVAEALQLQRSSANCASSSRTVGWCRQQVDQPMSPAGGCMRAMMTWRWRLLLLPAVVGSRLHLRQVSCWMSTVYSTRRPTTAAQAARLKLLLLQLLLLVLLLLCQTSGVCRVTGVSVRCRTGRLLPGRACCHHSCCWIQQELKQQLQRNLSGRKQQQQQQQQQQLRAQAMHGCCSRQRKTLQQQQQQQQQRQHNLPGRCRCVLLLLQPWAARLQALQQSLQALSLPPPPLQRSDALLMVPLLPPPSLKLLMPLLTALTARRRRWSLAAATRPVRSADLVRMPTTAAAAAAGNSSSSCRCSCSQLLQVQGCSCSSLEHQPQSLPGHLPASQMLQR